MIDGISHIFPEILTALSALVLLLLGVYGKEEQRFERITYLSMLVLVAVGYQLLYIERPGITLFGGQFIQDNFSIVMKAIAVLAAVLLLMLSLGWKRGKQEMGYEFPILMLLSTVGMMVMISSYDLISLYMGLELQSLALYVLVVIRGKGARSAEAGLKYFMLGALASGILLYGISLLYGFVGSTSLDSIYRTIAWEDLSMGATLGLVLCIIGFLFKLSAVPFHMWAPDVYEGAPKPVTAFLATAPKVAAVAVLIRFLYDPFVQHIDAWQPIIGLVAALSMIIGALGAIRQFNIKRLMAYSSIGHIGYVLLGVASGTIQGVQAVVLYLMIYVIMNIGVFTIIALMKRHDNHLDNIGELSGLARNHPIMAACLAILLLSMAGIPPMAGFFGKFYIFIAALQAELYALAVLGVLSSVIAAYYYLRIIKIMYFDAPNEALDRDISREQRFLLAGTTLFNLLFFLMPEAVIRWSHFASSTFF